MYEQPSAQGNGALNGLGNRFPSMSGPRTKGGDSLQTRNKLEDSITIRYYYLDSNTAHKLDSSINDFTLRFPLSGTSIYLGNTGQATRSLIFNPGVQAGWDPGFHAYDAYKLKLEQVRFYNTTRPYTELGYMVGSRSEQLLQVTHTQNIKPYWNFSLNYQQLNATGYFRNQRTNHNNYLFTSWYQAPAKRYNNYLILLYNKLQAGENGGLTQDSNLNNITYVTDRFTVPTNLGGTSTYSPSYFSSSIYTGHQYKEFNLLIRQQYDFGRKDSLVTDSTVIPLFYPSLRFEHTFKYAHESYTYLDYPTNGGTQSNLPDTSYYLSHYNLFLPSGDSIRFNDSYSEINNDFSIYQFPDSKNLQQFIKLGADLQLIHGTILAKKSFGLYNVMGHGEYRNRSKNQKWDILAYGSLHLNGYNAGDYDGLVSLKRLISPSIGSLQVGFENVNSAPPFSYDTRSSFYLDQVQKSFAKENVVHFFGTVYQPRLALQLRGDYYLVNKYLYLQGFTQLAQEPTLFNVLIINALKTFHLGRHWAWVAEAYFQQKTGPAPVHFPSAYTRDRLMYEGNLGFKNLHIAFGTEVRYHSPYKADGYSPIQGQFYFQDSVTINNRPDIALFLHFRIRSFKAYLRGENLNTASFVNGFHFNNNNFAAPGYPTPGLIIRFGVFWSFVN
ncbi:MAG: hypothetical protein NVS9B7_07020 [Flavisolibacter sp.]